MDCDTPQYVKGCIRPIINQDFQEDPESSKKIRPGALFFFLRAPVSTVRGVNIRGYWNWNKLEAFQN